MRVQYCQAGNLGEQAEQKEPNPLIKGSTRVCTALEQFLITAVVAVVALSLDVTVDQHATEAACGMRCVPSQHLETV